MSTNEDPKYTVIYAAREVGDFTVVAYAFFKTEEKACEFHASRNRPIAIRAYNPLSDYPHRGDILETTTTLHRGPLCKECHGKGYTGEPLSDKLANWCQKCHGNGNLPTQ